MTILSLIIFLASILGGILKPKLSAWAMIILYPLFTPMNLAIVPSDILFLNIDRIAFAIAIGIHLKN